MSYIKWLDHVARVNTEAIANMSTVVKDFMIQSQDKFYEVTRDMWLNLTIHSQSSVYLAVRQLEFAVLQLTQQLDELLVATQSILLGKLLIALINHPILLNSLRNISVNLSENYDLVAGTQQGNVHLYYDLIIVSVIGNAHILNMVMIIPLKTASQHFTLHKLTVLPTTFSETNLLSMFMISLIWFFRSTNATSPCLKKLTYNTVVMAFSRCAHSTYLFTTLKYQRVRRNCTFRCQERNQRVDGDY